MCAQTVKACLISLNKGPQMSPPHTRNFRLVAYWSAGEIIGRCLLRFDTRPIADTRRSVPSRSGASRCA